MPERNSCKVKRISEKDPIEDTLRSIGVEGFCGDVKRVSDVRHHRWKRRTNERRQAKAIERRLREDGARKVSAGLTSVEEIIANTTENEQSAGY